MQEHKKTCSCRSLEHLKSNNAFWNEVFFGSARLGGGAKRKVAAVVRYHVTAERIMPDVAILPQPSVVCESLPGDSAGEVSTSPSFAKGILTVSTKPRIPHDSCNNC